MSKKPPRRPAHKQQPSAESADHYFQAGMQCAEKEDYIGVIQNMTRAIQLSPELGRAYFHRGLARYVLGDSTEAIQDLADSVDLNSAAIASFMEMGQMAGEEVMLRMVAPLLAEIFEACFEAALIFLEVEEFKLALAALNQAAEIYRDEPDVYVQRGLAYQGLGNHAKAVADFSRVLRLDPESADALLHRGITYRIMGQYDKALEDFARLEESEVEIQLVMAERGIVYAAQGQWDTALAEFERVCELEPKNLGFPLLLKIMAQAQVGQTQAALDNWKVFITISKIFAPPNSVVSLREIGKLYPPMQPAAEKLIEALGGENADQSTADTAEE